jgi:hypothetical protein
LSLSHLNKESIEQYQFEERTLITFRLASSRYRIKDLLDIMTRDEISVPAKVNQLKNELSAMGLNTAYMRCNSMGEVVKTHLKQTTKEKPVACTKEPGEEQ